MIAMLAVKISGFFRSHYEFDYLCPSDNAESFASKSRRTTMHPFRAMAHALALTLLDYLIPGLAFGRAPCRRLPEAHAVICPVF